MAAGRIRSFLHAGALALALCTAGQGAPAQEVSGLPPPVPVRDGVARVTLETLGTALPNRRGFARFDFGAPDPDRPAVDPGQTDTAAAVLRRLVASGRAAGHHGDLYDNRDRGHSALPPELFPQLARVVYGPELVDAGLDYGAVGPLIFDATVLGNSSTALTGATWRSQARYLLTLAEGGPLRLWQNYLAGQIHVYPEHRDHDPERGDVFPANTPYYLVSQGSSGSDQAHLRALAMILAAFRPDTKALLRQSGLLAATVQMVYRRSRAGVLSRDDYLSGAAHPSAFDAESVAPGRMIALANAIAADTVPPMVLLQVEDETLAADERLFDTPAAIARIWRAATGRHDMVVSAAATEDPAGRALQFTWVLLRGDPERVRINPLDSAGTRARIVIDWQAPRPVPGGTDLTSHRVDIGVFAFNGVHDSAPSFVSVLLPGHEGRVYAPDAEGVPRLVTTVPDDSVYADPLLYPSPGD